MKQTLTIRTDLLLAPLGTFASGGVEPETSTVQLLDDPDWRIAPDPVKLRICKCMSRNQTLSLQG
jgi:hypothetical protein